MTPGLEWLLIAWGIVTVTIFHLGDQFSLFRCHCCGRLVKEELIILFHGQRTAVDEEDDDHKALSPLVPCSPFTLLCGLADGEPTRRTLRVPRRFSPGLAKRSQQLFLFSNR
jgi:hypothetical protein